MGEPPVFPLPPPAQAGVSCRVEAGAAFDWLRQGWAMFAAGPAVWFGASLLVLLGGLALCIVPLIGPRVAALLLPVVMAGFLQMCRHQQDGEAPRLSDLFAGFQAGQGALVVIGVCFMLALWGIGGLADLLATTRPGGGPWAMFGGWMRGLLLTLPLLLPLLMALFFAPALALFNRLPAAAAMRASFVACAANGLPLLVFGLILGVLAFFAALPILLGFLILLPVMVGASYAAYRDIFPSA